MIQAETATLFSALHVSSKPLVLYNIWDAGSAKAVAVSGAKAVATGSWSMVRIPVILNVQSGPS